ncbi:MAG: hypothetical protein ACE5HE_13685 [Phycisphaerae bacterium]
MNVKSLRLVGAILTTIPTSAVGSIIDDKSQFVGDFTLIDFETGGDGSPLILEEGAWIELMPDEYAPLGVPITGSLNFLQNERAFVANDRSPQSDAAQAIAGSPPNLLAHGGGDGFLRFDFLQPVNAVGMAADNRTDSAIMRIEVYDSADAFIEAVDFGDELVDGTIFGSDFGEPWDLEYGFVGLFQPVGGHSPRGPLSGARER